MIWLFDYDLTLYDREEMDVLLRLDRNITRFIQVRFGLEEAAADGYRQNCLLQYGTTLAGLRALHRIDPKDYFDFIHQRDTLRLPRPNPPLRTLLKSLPGSAWIFTNARRDWAEMGLTSIGIADCFQGILDIESFNWICKPDPSLYSNVALRVRKNQEPIVFLDDHPANLIPARDLGWRTVLVHPKPDAMTEGFDLVLPRLLDLKTMAPAAWFKT
jgi:putative hydrolase of the HAD superfamily